MVHQQLDLQLGDALLCRAQLGFLHAAQPRRQTAVDAVLAAPGLNDLNADPQHRSNLGDRLSGINQVKHLAPELQRIPTTSHTSLLGTRGSQLQ